MQKLLIILMLAVTGTVSIAQDTAYISRERTTALFFRSAVRIIGRTPAGCIVLQKNEGLITLKAARAEFSPAVLEVQDIPSAKIYRIPVCYSYVWSGRRILLGELHTTERIGTLENAYAAMAGQLLSGKCTDLFSRKKTGGMKARAGKISLDGNRIFFRLDVRNRSNLPYELDFVRFYVRDLKTATRTATHEQEIVPVYVNQTKSEPILKGKTLANVFAFCRFALSKDQALDIELYERNGNRNLYLQLKQKDLDKLQTIHSKFQHKETLLGATQF